MIPDWLVPVPADRDQMWRLAQFRAAHPDVTIGPGGFNTWQALVPQSNGEIVVTRDLLGDLLDALYEIFPPDAEGPAGGEQDYGDPGG